MIEVLSFLVIWDKLEPVHPDKVDRALENISLATRRLDLRFS